jgi:hypothetical protein
MSAGLATDVLWNATGDLVVGAGDNSATILPIVATDNYLLATLSGNLIYRQLDGGSP